MAQSTTYIQLCIKQMLNREITACDMSHICNDHWNHRESCLSKIGATYIWCIEHIACRRIATLSRCTDFHRFVSSLSTSRKTRFYANRVWKNQHFLITLLKTFRKTSTFIFKTFNNGSHSSSNCRLLRARNWFKRCSAPVHC